jgi:hypothetical protein
LRYKCNVSLNTFTIASGYSGTISRSGSYTFSTTNFSQAAGVFNGGTVNMSITGSFTLSGGTFNASSWHHIFFINFTHSGGVFDGG